MSETGHLSIFEGNDAAALLRDIRRHIVSTLGADDRHLDRFRVYQGLAHAVRDRLVESWLTTQRSYYDHDAKRVYYLSLEFLPGRFLRNNLHCLGMLEAAEAATAELGFTLEEVEELEWDAGLGNGGLGRLASCFLESMATLRLPVHGYGIRYDYGIFFQIIRNGSQVERPDHWLRRGSPWVLERPEHLYQVLFHGRVKERRDASGRLCFDWVDTSNVMAMACDILVPGYRNGNVVNMRLWSARASREFDLGYFNSGNYIGAIEEKARSENISKVLYPSDTLREGQELRLKQEYFLVAATFQDIFRRLRKRRQDVACLPELVAVQLNDTHPAIAVAELMRILIDEEGLDWVPAWEICGRTLGFTNHTVMPEALESWAVELVEWLLPRHLQIIYEIDRRFLDEVAVRYPAEPERLARVSLIAEGQPKRVRMTNLAVVGSHSVNGVSALHTRILKKTSLRELAELFPERFSAVTNGVNHRRFLLQANPGLSALISEAIGTEWIEDAMALRALEHHADDSAFRSAWRRVRQENKERLARWMARTTGAEIDPSALLDVQAKRIHEYKRQLLNLLHVITLYNRIKDGAPSTPRTVLIGGKAAPAYAIAKLVVKLASAVSEALRCDEQVRRSLSLFFVPNYCVSVAERLLPACDLSEQISTAGTEASGTGNMKFTFNGALIIGTHDGANIEIAEAIGAENMFLFGHTEDEVRELRAGAYDPRAVAAADPQLGRALWQIADGRFSPGEPALFWPLLDVLFDWGDHFQVLADYRAYLECQERVAALYQDQEAWTRRSILSVARTGWFSSDRAVREYAEGIWGVRPLACLAQPQREPA